VKRILRDRRNHVRREMRPSRVRAWAAMTRADKKETFANVRKRRTMRLAYCSRQRGRGALAGART
jgi:hypothetical protein